MATEEYQVGYEAGYQDGWNAAQKPFVGLTDEDIAKAGNLKRMLPYAYARAIEKLLRSKNGGAA